MHTLVGQHTLRTPRHARICVNYISFMGASLSCLHASKCEPLFIHEVTLQQRTAGTGQQLCTGCPFCKQTQANTRMHVAEGQTNSCNTGSHITRLHYTRACMRDCMSQPCPRCSSPLHQLAAGQSRLTACAWLICCCSAFRQQQSVTDLCCCPASKKTTPG